MLTDIQRQNMISNRRGSPHFKVRRAVQISEELGLEAIADGFVNVPIHTFMEGTMEDDLSFTGCNYMAKVAAERGPKDSSYTEVLPTRDELAPSFGEEFAVYNETKEDFEKMPFSQMEMFSDLIFAEKFEGYKQKVNWSDEEWGDILSQLDAVLLDGFDVWARNFYISM